MWEVSDLKSTHRRDSRYDTNNQRNKVLTIYTKPEEAVDLEKAYYHGVYVFLEFNIVSLSTGLCSVT